MAATLVPMSRGDFDSYFEGLIVRYAGEHVRTGRWTPEEGESKAREEVQRILTNGVDTPNNFLLSIVASPSGEKVGLIWLAIEPRGGFIYDLEISEPHRRKGYAEEAMRLIERTAREKGAQRISLHVFGDNLGARKLYTKIGYAETNVMMSKPLPP
jgi:ribosomal protein S18 acetylase RimI-like enzyme